MGKRELGSQRDHLYRMRFKRAGWYGRRFGKNPRWQDMRSDGFRNAKRAARACIKTQ